MLNKIAGIVVALALVLVVAGSVWSLSQQKGDSNENANDDAGNVACPADAQLCSDGTYVGRRGPNCEFEPCRMVARPPEEMPEPEFVRNTKGGKSIIWAFNELPVDASGIPRTEVSVMVNGSRDIIGVYEGSCIVVDNVTVEGKRNSEKWPLLKGELTGAICWYAGGGYEVAVFEEGDKLLVRVGLLGEGTAETPGTRGGFKTVKSL